MDTVNELLASRPALVRRLVVNAFVVMAGLFIMLARTSPALAADNSHGQGKSHDSTSSSAVTQRHNGPGHQTDQEIGGSGGGDGNNGKSKSKNGGSSDSSTSAGADAKASREANATVTTLSLIHI